MFKQYTKIVYAAAIVAGIVGISVSVSKPFFVAGLIYFLLGAIFGFFWPREEWRWGLCISLPIVGLLGLSILFSGFGGNIRTDLYFLLAIITGSTAGSFAGSFIGMRVRPLR